MKVKVFGIFLIICLMAILLPVTVLGYEDKDSYKNGNITYQLFNDGTAKIISIEDDLVDGCIRIDDVLYNKEFYQITTIGANVLNQLTEEHELQIFYNESPKLEDGNSFENISNIYIPFGAEGYTEENGWEEAKLKNYKITQQPQDVTVTAGDIKDTDIIKISASIPVLLVGSSITYNWYFCDETGNILEKANLESAGVTSSAGYKIPEDLSYDNENNQAKDYYLVCVIGENYRSAIPEKSRIVKITVNPGTYKVSFNAEWVTGEDSLVVSVNSERKLNDTDIPSIENLKPIGEGVSFVGWSIDGINIVDPAEIIFDKNTTLFPIWQFVINFDANGGCFENGNDVLEYWASYNDDELYNKILDMEVPVRDGYSFLGFYTEKTGGTKLESYIEDEDNFLDGNLTFYAQWKKVDSNEEEPTQQPEEEIESGDNNNDLDSEISDNTNNSNTNNGNNPQTSDNILFFMVILFISLLGVIVTSKYIKYSNKK